MIPSGTRNIGILAHIDAGKTTLTERILYATGFADVPGEVDEGTTIMDWMAQEQARGITITSAAIRCHWAGCAINLIDTPGHVDFMVEVGRCLRVLDGAIVVFSGVDGVQVRTETVWREADRFHVPRLAFINKMDRLGADHDMVLLDIQDRLGANVLPVTLPIGQGEAFEGLIDVVGRRALRFSERREGAVVEAEVPPELREAAEAAREELIDAALEDEAHIGMFLETGDLPEALVWPALRKAVLAGRITPVFCGAALRHIGVQPLLDGVVRLLPRPEDLPPVRGAILGDPVRLGERAPSADAPTAALVFKVTRHRREGTLWYLRLYSGSLRVGDTLLNPRTAEREKILRVYRILADGVEELAGASAGDIVAVSGLRASTTGDTLCDERAPIALEAIEAPEPVVFVALELQSEEHDEAVTAGLRRLLSEDPSLRTWRDEGTGRHVLAGLGELHLEIARERLVEDAGHAVRAGLPQVSYRQTITTEARAVGLIDRQLHGRGFFAQVELAVRPLLRGAGLRVEVRLDPAQVSSEYWPAIETGIRGACDRGGGGGLPLTDVEVVATAGLSREADSSPMAFVQAAALAVRRALDAATIVDLEPIMRVEISTPGEYTGAVIGDLSSRRGRLSGMVSRGTRQVLTCAVPLSNLFGYASELRSMSQGRATLTIQFSQYDIMPSHLASTLRSTGGR
ncbi:MAG: elongation factor G [Alphaproteobacteria bacterium]|nr:elongation factor G [Alphaproteobacteria bacterium]